MLFRIKQIINGKQEISVQDLPYRKHTRSRYLFKTYINRPGGKKGHLVVGHTNAKKDIESDLKRSLAAGTRVKKCGGNWVFYEPQSAVA